MKFSEKLQKLRKENRLSQEELANMLDVSRQSVSKWESGQTYPEMDKLIAMCKIFKCSMDDLTNDEVKDINLGAKNKNTAGNLISEILDIINKSLKMFKAMPLKKVMECIIGMLIVLIIIAFLHIPVEYIYRLGNNILSNFGHTISSILSSIWLFILEIAYLIIAAVLFVYVFKNRYLDNFDDSEYAESKIVDNTTEVIEEVSNKKREKIIKFKKSNNNFIIFPVLGTIFTFFVKVLLFLIGWPFMLLLFILFIGIVLWIGLLFKGVIYFGIFILLLSAVILNILLLEIIFNFLVNKSLSIKRTFLTLVICIAGFGLGAGITMFDVANTSYIDTVPKNVRQDVLIEEFAMTDDLLIYLDYYNMEMVVNNEIIDKVILEITYYPEFKTPYITYHPKYNSLYEMPDYENMVYIYDNYGEKHLQWELFNIITRDLRKRQVHNYTKLYDINVKLTASETNINELTKRYSEYMEKQIELQRQDEINNLNNLIYEYQDRIYELEEQIRYFEENNNIYEDYQEELNECQSKLQEYRDRINELLYGL